MARTDLLNGGLPQIFNLQKKKQNRSSYEA